MAQDDLDRILSGEQEIMPSSGFVAEVMAAVQREAVAPPAIPFPWKRALPGIAAAVSAVALVLGSLLMGAKAHGPTLADLPPGVTSVLHVAHQMGAGWIAIALVISLVSVKLATGLAVGRT